MGLVLLTASDDEDEWRRRLAQVVGDHGGKSAVSRLVPIPLQTLKNHLSGRTKNRPLDDLRKIAASCDVDYEWLAVITTPPARQAQSQSQGPAPGAREDAVEYVGAPRNWSKGGPNDGGRWKVTTRALELAGVLPGDVLEFDFSLPPRPDDIVVAQLYRSGGAKTVLRVFRPPALLVATTDPSIDPTPILLDDTGGRVNVRGPMVRLLRERS